MKTGTWLKLAGIGLFSWVSFIGVLLLREKRISESELFPFIVVALFALAGLGGMLIGMVLMMDAHPTQSQKESGAH